MAKRSDSFSWASLFSRLTVSQNANLEPKREFPPQNAPAFLKHGVVFGPQCVSKGETARFRPPISALRLK